MKLFIDSAKIEEINELFDAGMIEGVTTNPSLIKKAVDDLKKQGRKIDLEEYIKHILAISKGTPVSLEVTETIFNGMVEQAKKIYKKFNGIANNVYIKIPVNTSFTREPRIDGIKAIKELSKLKIPVNCTLIFTPEQALLAAKAGAAFVSPFTGRIDDYLREKHGIHFEKSEYYPMNGLAEHGSMFEDNGIVSGIDLVRQIVEIFKKQNIQCKVLAASLRNARQVREAALVGADIATAPYSVIKELLVHYKTQEGMKLFREDIVPEYHKLIS